MTDLYEALLIAKGEQIVGRIDPRRDAPIHSYVREVAPRPLPESQLLPMSLMDSIAAFAFFIGAAVIAAAVVWGLWAALLLAEVRA